MTGNVNDAKGNGEIFRQLHHNGKLLVLPNVWDPIGARLLESLGYPAVATASASIAVSNGYADGENIPFDEVVRILKKIVQSVNIPVSADIESGYTKQNPDLKENIKKLVDTGITGINFEDSNRDLQELVSIKEQCEKIEKIRSIADSTGSHFFINARSDVYIKSHNLPEEEKLKQVIERGQAYKEAGADGFYPITLKNKTGIETVIKEVSLPVNILLIPGVPDFEALNQIGLARLSLGPGFLKIAINAMKNVAEKLLDYEGMNDIKDNPVTSDYLNSLIHSQHEFPQTNKK
jgi:2-methylisocitrate lyase-like PEP mutase family enzyme